MRGKRFEIGADITDLVGSGFIVGEDVGGLAEIAKKASWLEMPLTISQRIRRQVEGKAIPEEVFEITLSVDRNRVGTLLWEVLLYKIDESLDSPEVLLGLRLKEKLRSYVIAEVIEIIRSSLVDRYYSETTFRYLAERLDPSQVISGLEKAQAEELWERLKPLVEKEVEK